MSFYFTKLVDINLGQSIKTKNMQSEAQPSNLVLGAHEPIWNMMYAFPDMDEQSDFQESGDHNLSSMETTSYKKRNSAKFPKEPTWNMMYAFPSDDELEQEEDGDLGPWSKSISTITEKSPPIYIDTVGGGRGVAISEHPKTSSRSIYTATMFSDPFTLPEQAEPQEGFDCRDPLRQHCLEWNQTLMKNC